MRGCVMAGVTRLTMPVEAMKGWVKAGHNVTLRHAEVLQVSHVYINSPHTPESGQHE
jgi:hypothetical protein